LERKIERKKSEKKKKKKAEKNLDDFLKLVRREENQNKDFFYRDKYIMK